jgi:hypothetical protein
MRGINYYFSSHASSLRRSAVAYRPWDAQSATPSAKTEEQAEATSSGVGRSLRGGGSG